jgi:hypothetical protein
MSYIFCTLSNTLSYTRLCLLLTEPNLIYTYTNELHLLHTELHLINTKLLYISCTLRHILSTFTTATSRSHWQHIIKNGRLMTNRCFRKHALHLYPFLKSATIAILRLKHFIYSTACLHSNGSGKVMFFYC